MKSKTQMTVKAKNQEYKEEALESGGIIPRTPITFTLGKVFYQFHTPAAIPLGKEPLDPLDMEIKWTPEPVRTN